VSIFGDLFDAVTWLLGRRTNVTVEVTHALVDSNAPMAFSLANPRPRPKVYRLEIRTTNRGERTEYMTSMSVEALDGSASQELTPESSAWAILPREPLSTVVPLSRLGFDATGLELRATAHLTSGDVSSTPTRLDAALIAELEDHNRRAEG